MPTLSDTLELASRLHSGQKDLGGGDYIGHLKWVMRQVAGNDAKTVALLHDAMEDCDVGPNDLFAMGYSFKIVSALVTLTKKDGTPRFLYILGVAVGSRVALDVKIADLSHNSMISRIPEPKEWHRKRISMYKREKVFLSIVRLLRLGW